MTLAKESEADTQSEKAQQDAGEVPPDHPGQLLHMPHIPKGARPKNAMDQRVENAAQSPHGHERRPIERQRILTKCPLAEADSGPHTSGGEKSMGHRDMPGIPGNENPAQE